MPTTGVLYGGIPQMTLAGVPIYTTSNPPEEACCCPDGGCCSGNITGEETLHAEIIDATNNCATIGSNEDMPGTGFLWATVDCLDTACFNAIQLACANDEIGFTLTADGTGCVANSPCPDTTNYTAELISITCNPFELIFEITMTLGIPPQCECCDANVGVVTVKITKA